MACHAPVSVKGFRFRGREFWLQGIMCMHIMPCSGLGFRGLGLLLAVGGFGCGPTCLGLPRHVRVPV